MRTIYEGPAFEAAVDKLLGHARQWQSRNVLAGFGDRQRRRAEARQEAKARRRAEREARHRDGRLSAMKAKDVRIMPTGVW